MSTETRRETFDYERLADFLSERRYAALASLRKDGSPFAIPLGYLYQDGCIFVTIGRIRAGLHRIRRDARVSICIADDEYPPSFVLVNGHAEEIHDPKDEISLRISARYLQPYPGRNYEEHKRNWLGYGRVVFRIPVNDDTVTFADGQALARAVAIGVASYEEEGAGVIVER